MFTVSSKTAPYICFHCGQNRKRKALKTISLEPSLCCFHSPLSCLCTNLVSGSCNFPFKAPAGQLVDLIWTCQPFLTVPAPSVLPWASAPPASHLGLPEGHACLLGLPEKPWRDCVLFTTVPAATEKAMGTPGTQHRKRNGKGHMHLLILIEDPRLECYKKAKSQSSSFYALCPPICGKLKAERPSLSPST